MGCATLSAQSMPRDMYLEDIPLEEALARFWSALDAAGGLAPLPGESVPVEDVLGRVTAEPVFAAMSVPHYHAAAMDGIAVRAEETNGATETTPLRLVPGAQAVWVDTGEPLPAEMNAVIMAEHVQELPNGTLAIMAPAPPWQHVRPMGEDIVATELVLPESHLLRPVDLGAATAAGHRELRVRRRPRVAILPTGTELVEPGGELKPGEVVDFNSPVLAGQVREWGGEPTRFSPTPDDFNLLLARVQEALAEHDLVVINAGSSAGSEDHTARVVAEAGRLLVHGVAIRPGHPLILGVAPAGKALLGIPGYPVSTILTSELFLRPLLFRLLDLPLPERPTLRATMTRKLLSPMGEDEVVRVKLGQVGERVVAAPLSRGAGVIMSMVRADGLVRIPRFSEGVHAGAEVDVELLRPEAQVRRTVVAIGSHDLALDLLSAEMARTTPGASLASANVGSMGGLLALARNEAHLAGSHLLDEATGEYNVAAVERYLPGRRVVIVTLAGRIQGLMVPPGNPKRIEALTDLARPDVQFVNRQRGSGTRVLLDYRLRQSAIDPLGISGYDREEYTHLAVAAAVASGAADAGLGILAAARALGLEFLPLLEERYDLVIPREHHESAHLQPLLRAVAGEPFRHRVAALGGYNVSAMGQVAWSN